MLSDITGSLARLYANGPAATPTTAELAAFRQWLWQQWRSIPARIVYTARDVDLATVKRIYLQVGTLLVSTANNAHPFFTFNENAQFRAVHDWHHIIGGSDDTMEGEISTYLVTRSTAPQSVWWILFSEIVLQAAAYYGAGAFQAQKLVRV